MQKVVVVGGGAAGLMSAVSASRAGADVTVIEKNSRPVRKLLITGKGRCNLTNNCDVPTLISNTPRNGKFLYSAFSEFSSADTMRFFENCAVPLKTERGNRVFPVSDKSRDIADALVREVSKNCRIIKGRANKITVSNGAVSGVMLDDNTVISADSVILATGGLSYPLTGSTGDGYIIAENLGHTVTELVPSLVAIRCHEGFCTRLAGLSLKNVTLNVFERGRKKPVYTELGEMLFTHTGVSGPLSLSASAHINHPESGKYTAVIDLKPALSEEMLDRRILRDFSSELNRDFANALDGLLPRSIIPVITALSGIDPHTKVNQISRAERTALVKTIKNFTLRITGFNPVEEAVITRGGISVREIDPSTMGSKLLKGLYFAGEIIDVDAYTGGFNLQIAFATGNLAGKSAARTDITIKER